MFDYSARPELLKGRVILVTGAGRGIGAAAAKTYAAHGATVLLLGKTEANLAQVYDEIEAAGHAQPVVIPFNLETALPHQYDELAAMIEKEFGHLDGLLHNASIIGPRTPIEQLSGENFMRVMHINVNAMFMLTSTLLPLLKLSQDASVVFTSSSVGRKGRAYWGAYGVSKFATEGLMQTLADEVADLHDRLETRKLIDRAKGLLMKALNLSEPEAFSWIQRAAMDRRLTMKEVAEAVINPNAVPDK